MKWNTKYNNWKVENGCSLVPGLYFITMGTKSIPWFFMHGHFQSCYGILIKYSENQGEDKNLKGSGYFLGCQGNIAWEDWKTSQSIFSRMVFQAAVCSGMGINPQFSGIVFVPTMIFVKQGHGLGEPPQQGEAVGSVGQTGLEQAVVFLVSLRVCTWDAGGALGFLGLCPHHEASPPGWGSQSCQQACTACPGIAPSQTPNSALRHRIPESLRLEEPLTPSSATPDQSPPRQPNQITKCHVHFFLWHLQEWGFHHLPVLFQSSLLNSYILSRLTHKLALNMCLNQSILKWASAAVEKKGEKVFLWVGI